MRQKSLWRRCWIRRSTRMTSQVRKEGSGRLFFRTSSRASRRRSGAFLTTPGTNSSRRTASTSTTSASSTTCKTTIWASNSKPRSKAWYREARRISSPPCRPRTTASATTTSWKTRSSLTNLATNEHFTNHALISTTYNWPINETRLLAKFTQFQSILSKFILIINLWNIWKDS